ncbi:hypothetical protein [Bacillus sp. FJAT-45350]|uniref:hypothetical protein n=1 Tax=Bacillus sp. FJAT-45350 TaxID=2011014 RepID=UPI0015C9E1A6|nr:hypothetical protein [Bacillus sp. FJAT-45350]
MSTEKKKVSLQEAIKQKLAEKKQAQAAGKANGWVSSNQTMKSQQTKKSNNQRKRRGV